MTTSAAGPIVLPGRFNGPPTSAHGGYTSGVVASLVAAGASVTDDAAVEVVLRAPPPLDTPLEVSAEPDGSISLHDGGTLVAVGAPASLALDGIPPISPAEASRAAREGPPAMDLATHPFPTCFGCGPARADGDGLRLHPVALPDEGRPQGVIATGWTPGPDFAGADGRLDATLLWAALDCPSGWAVLDERSGPAVLGRLAGRVLRRPLADEPLAVAAWPVGATQGRKRAAASAILDEEGRLVAAARATWVVLERPIG